MAKKRKAVNENIEEVIETNDVEEIIETEEVEETETEEVVEVEKKPVYNTTNTTNKFDRVKQIMDTVTTFEGRLNEYKKVDSTLASIIKVFENYQEEYKQLKINNQFMNERDINSTINLYSAIKYLLSPEDQQDFKISIEILLDIIRNYRTQSLHPMSYASGLDKWTGAPEDAEELLCIMHALNTLILDGPNRTLSQINFNKFKHGQKIKDYVVSL